MATTIPLEPQLELGAIRLQALNPQVPASVEAVAHGTQTQTPVRLFLVLGGKRAALAAGEKVHIACLIEACRWRCEALCMRGLVVAPRRGSGLC